ncbi:BadF/BadG/BcrA/BcrD ATPase family protein, partial [Angustibacter aerolatus]
MTAGPSVVGVDVGGTKTHVVVASPAAVLLEAVRPSAGWNPRPWDDGARWLQRLLDDVHPAWPSASAVVVGAHGCDSPEHVTALQAALVRVTGREVLVHNDAELVLPAAGLTEGVGVIVGTGSIAAGHRAGHPTTLAGGWGWLLGDEGSAPTLVRAAVRAVAARLESGLPADPLGELLMGSFGVTSAAELIVAVSQAGGIPGWSSRAPLVFDAVEAGSQDALDVVRAAAGELADLVLRLHRRGVPTDDVVLAGGVARAQPLVARSVDEAVAEGGLPAGLEVL